MIYKETSKENLQIRDVVNFFLYIQGHRLKDNYSKKITFILFSLFLTSYLFSQEIKIDYYGIVSDDLDSNMAKMTSDLYFTQLCEVNNFSITDRRTEVSQTEIPDSDFFSEEKLSFYTEIKKIEDSEKWTTTLHVYNKAANSDYTKTKEYDSFYKILVDSKQNLQISITSLIDASTNDLAVSDNDEDAISIDFSKAKSVISSESLSGNWIGENHIDKIVIMRGGRGFIILKNGASMNISIAINDSEIKIEQIGKPNASFFTELPRSLALNAAITAEPIKWILKSQDNNTLVGKKQTLVPFNDSYILGTIDVVWKRIN